MFSNCKSATEIQLRELTTELESVFMDIHAASISAIDILNDMLNYEKMDAGIFEVERKYLPVENLFRKSISNMTSFARIKDIRTIISDEVNATSPLPIAGTDDEQKYMMLVDQHCIDIVIRNLMTNAVKFTPAGGRIDVKFCVVDRARSNKKEAHEPHLRIEFTDSGVGLPPESISKLFGEFEQFDSRKLQGGGGSGLGLWICRNIVSLHGGIIGAYSNGHNSGSTFYIELPIQEYEGNLVEPISAPRDSSENLRTIASKIASFHIRREEKVDDLISGSLKRGIETNEDDDDEDDDEAKDFWRKRSHMRFLVVDDSPMSRKILVKLIRTEIQAISSTIKLDFIEADDGDTAIEKLKQFKTDEHFINQGSCGIDAIFIDNIMVRMNGPETVKFMRGNLKYTGLVIGITGNALKDDLKSFEAAGCNKALSKPVHFGDILKEIENHFVYNISDLV